MAASDILDSRPTTDGINLMLTEHDSSRYTSQLHAVYKFLKPIGKGLVNAHQCLLGRQDFCWTGTEFRFWVWERPTYRLFVSNPKGVSLEVPVDATRNDVLDALEQYRCDIQMSGGLLTGSEAADLDLLGREVIKGRELNIGSYSDDDLRKFVLACCDGKVWTDQDCRGTDIGMVFMPVVFGALSPPDEILEEVEKKLPAHPGDKPPYPPRPTAPDEPEYPETPERPPEPKWFQEDPERVTDIERKIGWQAADEGDLERYRTYIETKNQALREDYDVLLGVWEAECEEVWAQQETLEQQYEADMADYEKNAEADWKAECEQHEARLMEWRRAKERHDVARGGLGAQYVKDLGIIWEYVDKAGPRAVNGCPMFFSCHLMNREDWGRAYDAIQREAKRRKSFKI
jgi:hypothetical protein